MFGTLSPSFNLRHPCSRRMASRPGYSGKFRMNDKLSVFPGDRAMFPVLQNTTWTVLLPPTTWNTSYLFTIRAPCLIDWFHCLLLACLVANIVVIWTVTFLPVFFYLFVRMDYWFSVWFPVLLPSFCAVVLAAKVSVPFEVHRYNTGPHFALRESKVLIVGRIRHLQLSCGPQGYCDGKNLVNRLDINFYFPQNNNVISIIYCA